MRCIAGPLRCGILIVALIACRVYADSQLASPIPINVAEAVIEYAIANEWDVVEERTVFGPGPE